MSLIFYYHPLSSYCHKALIALYEHGVDFKAHLVDFMDEKAAAEFKALWPIRKFPVLQDEKRGVMVPESSIIIEYLDQHYSGGARLVPTEAEAALEARLMDRLFDLYVHMWMQKVMGDRLRAPENRDSYGVEDAKKQLTTAYGVLDKKLAGRQWAAGNAFTIADCAAAPALFYGAMAQPFAEEFPNLTAYFKRLKQRPSYARVLKEAEPYFQMIPK